MKSLLLLAILSVPMLAYAQEAPKDKPPTVAELQVQLAQKDVEIAQLRLELATNMVESQLVRQSCVAGTSVVQQAEQRLSDAKRAATASQRAGNAEGVK